VSGDPRQVLLDEFGCYYHSDDLSFVVLPHDVDSWADDSGRRLVHQLGDQAREAVALLNGVVRRDDDTLLEQLDRETWYGWSGSAENWELFCRIVARIEATVEKELAPAGDAEDPGDAAPSSGSSDTPH